MPITNISFRRGTSAILGTLIFVGIMFTAVIPMLLVMKQADTLHEMRKHDLEIVDEEKGREYLRVEISPVQTQEKMTLEVTNKGDLVTKVIRLWVNELNWVNEEDEDWNCLLNPNGVCLDELVVSSEPDSYSVIVVTEKGNLFVSDNALIHEGDGVWGQDDIYVIHVRIAADGVIFHIYVTYPSPSEIVEHAMVHKMGVGGTAYKAFIVTEGPGIYNVKITSGHKTIYDNSVTLTEDDKSEWVDA